MTVLRWILGIVAGLFLAGWLLCLAAYLARGDDRFKDLGVRLRQWVYTIALLWFNLEVWGRVVWTLVTWNRPPE